MTDYDVIVIGGGPAGCYAALSAAANGLKVALFEEHGAIGWPRHDPGWLMESRFAASIVKALGPRVPWLKVKEYRVSQPESGDLIETSKLGGYLVRRDLLEKELAGLAIKAGANFFLKTKVMRLITGEGKADVETSSSAIPKAAAKILICADGIRSTSNGLAVKEGLCQKAGVRPGVSYLLSNAEVTAGVIEHFLSSEPLLDYRCFFTHHEGASYVGMPSYAGFQELKERNDNVVSRKIKNAYPTEITGYGRGAAGRYGDYFPKIVKGNVMFIGDASGGSGNIHGMIQGHFAGMVAASAIKERDTGEKRLSEYQELVFSTLKKTPFCWFSARQDFGTFDNWFGKFEDATKGVEATELSMIK